MRTVASYTGSYLSNICDAHVVRIPFVLITSLIPKGIPPRFFLSIKLLSKSLAFSMAFQNIR